MNTFDKRFFFECKDVLVMPSRKLIYAIKEDAGKVIGKAIKFFTDENYIDKKFITPDGTNNYWTHKIGEKIIALFPYKENNKKYLLVIFEGEVFEINGISPEGQHRHGS